MRKIILTSIVISLYLSSFAQFGGNTTYEFLNLTTSARINALGGNQVGMTDDKELSFSYYNPATLNAKLDKAISLNYVNFFSDIKLGYAAYSQHFENIGTFAAGIHYINYGDFIEAQENGEITGNFTAADYALNLIYSRNFFDHINVGANIKPVYSVYEMYSSVGIAADLGVMYTDSVGLFSAGLVLKNMGVQITTYQELTPGQREPLPFDIQLGFSQKFAHAPFRISITMNHLLEWNLTDKSTWDFDHKDDDEYISGKSDDFTRQLMRHVILGAEFIPSENFIIGFGYNFQRRRELAINNNPGSVGLSGGFTVKINRFRLSYSIASYHLAGTSNTFSISTNLSEFMKSGGKRKYITPKFETEERKTSYLNY